MAIEFFEIDGKNVIGKHRTETIKEHIKRTAGAYAETVACLNPGDKYYCIDRWRIYEKAFVRPSYYPHGVGATGKTVALLDLLRSTSFVPCEPAFCDDNPDPPEEIVWDVDQDFLVTMRILKRKLMFRRDSELMFRPNPNTDKHHVKMVENIEKLIERHHEDK